MSWVLTLIAFALIGVSIVMLLQLGARIEERRERHSPQERIIIRDSPRWDVYYSRLPYQPFVF